MTYLTRNESCDWSSQWKWNTRILSVFCGSRPLGWTIVPDAASGTSVLGAGYLCEQLISAPFPQDSEKCKQIADKPGGTKFKVRLLEKLILFPHLPLEEMKELSSKTWCGNFRIFLLPRFYVKSIFGDSRSAKCAILKHLEALDFGFYEFLCFLEAEINQINTIQSLLRGQKPQF